MQIIILVKNLLARFCARANSEGVGKPAMASKCCEIWLNAFKQSSMVW